jgi:multimeric flavodoxin WrbA
MRKNLLIFTGSPRKESNSAFLALEAARAAKKVGASVELIDLSALKINPCLACQSCRVNGPGKCVQNDEMKKLYPRLQETEAIILAHPVYWFTINAQTKLFIDRWYAFGADNYASFKNKKFGLILTFADHDAFTSGAVNALRAYQDIFNYLEAKITGIVLASADRAGQVAKNRKVIKEAYDLGKKVVS